MLCLEFEIILSNMFENKILNLKKKDSLVFLDKRVVHVMFHEFTSEFHDIMILHFV